jgi:hypothetical protein
MRVSAKDAGMLAIDRENEHHNSVSAAEAGVGATVVDYVPEHSLLVLEFIEGTTQTSEDLRRGDKLAMVAAACRRLHGAAPFRDDFNMFRIQHRYLQLVQERGFRLPERYLEFEPQVRRIEEAMAVRDEGAVPCNNDLLAETSQHGSTGWFGTTRMRLPTGRTFSRAAACAGPPGARRRFGWQPRLWASRSPLPWRP